MKLTTLQLRNQARFKSNIDNTSTVTNDEILTQLNEGYSKLFSALVEADQDYYEEQRTKFDLVANCSLVSLPSDCHKIKQVRLAYTTPDSPDDYRVARFFDPSQTVTVSVDETATPVSNPQVDITNNYCRLMPKPTDTVSNGGEFYYIARPSALVNTGDSMILPEMYHDLASVYAGAKISEKVENYDKADRLMEEFNIGLEKMKQELAGREMNKEAVFKSSQQAGSRYARELT